jgi:general secretion pathway protein D
MKPSTFLRSIVAFALIFCLFTAPIFALDKKGDKNYKQGLKHEAAEQWDKAAEEFALALATNPRNAEYRLHYTRALFNASQMMMQRGRNLAEQKNYVAAYNAFRQAYGYDPVNELAKSEMERMVRLQKQLEDPNDPNNPNQPKQAPTAQPPGVKLVPTAYDVSSPTRGAAVPARLQEQIEQLRDIKYTKVDLKTVIKELAQTLDLNVLFDTQTFRQQKDVTIELKNVTTAQALDAIFLQESLFFQKVGKRMILVADQNQRQRFQQLVLRTFYLANAKPDDIRNVLQQAIPPQPGRPPTQAIVDKDTNSLTVRDTSENIRLISNLIKALDKDRSEVVMDVNIYEVSKSDLLQLGNQIGDASSLVRLGGTTNSFFGSRGGRAAVGETIANVATNGLAAGILFPAATISALQSKGTARLLASTQVHAFNNEESTARIGQRVPVRTAQLLGYGNNGTGGNNNNGGNFNYNNAAAVYNYEQVGLTLKFTPIVFPNQDVQVKMSIESKDVGATAGVDENPSFTERSITGTARIQNNRTLLLASVAQDTQTSSRSGLPVLGLIPVLGRLFSTPRKDNRQVDIVIAVTPRVLRAPSILPEDEVEQPTGSIAVPTNSSLADMIIREDQEDQLANARRLTNNVVVQLPDSKPEDNAAPSYVPANGSVNGQGTAATNAAPASPSAAVRQVVPKPIESSAIKTLNIAPTSENAAPKSQKDVNSDIPAELKIEPLSMLKAGEKRRIAVMVKSPLALRAAILSLGYDASKIRIKRIVYGGVFGNELAGKDAPPFAAGNGRLTATFQMKENQTTQGVGVLAYLEIEAITDAESVALQINNTVSSLVGYGGETLVLN